jgi:hypothetical protein
MGLVLCWRININNCFVNQDGCVEIVLLLLEIVLEMFLKVNC